MTRYENYRPSWGAGPDGVPLDFRNQWLWRDARQTLDRHAGPDPAGDCGWCGRPWPCPPRRLAERAEAVALQPWPASDSWSSESWLSPSAESRRRPNSGLFD
jgi:hypothetical protein